MDLRQQLFSQGKQIGIELTTEQQDKLIQFIEMLHKWNQHYNLTAIRQLTEMVSRHLLDSLTIAPFIRGHRILDVGTGPGIPGIPLAILFPEKNFTLLDSNNKKTRFITQTIYQLGLHNVNVVNQRVENYQNTHLFDTIVSRAFSELGLMLNLTRHLAAPKAQFLAMKGKLIESELAQVLPPFQVLTTQSLQVPGEKAQRHLIIIQEQ